jgi:hypothetical protein
MASTLISSFNEIQEYLDELQIDTENDSSPYTFIVDPIATQKLKKAVSLTVGNIVSLSFNLKQERIETLSRNWDLLSLCFYLYGSTDEKIIDQFISTNELSVDEIIVVPSGRKIKYYV